MVESNYQFGKLQRFIMTLGERLKNAREAKEWTQAELGKKLGVSDATINRYEKEQRRPDPEMLRRLADILDVSIDYLTGRVDSARENALKYETLAAHRTDDPITDLPPEAQKSLEEFKEFILRKYGKSHKE